MSDEEITFESAEAGSADCVPIRAGELKKGMHVVIKGHPCKIVDISTSKTGKHGHAKANITALDIFTDRKYEDVAPTSANMSAPLGACAGAPAHERRRRPQCARAPSRHRAREPVGAALTIHLASPPPRTRELQ